MFPDRAAAVQSGAAEEPDGPCREDDHQHIVCRRGPHREGEGQCAAQDADSQRHGCQDHSASGMTPPRSMEMASTGSPARTRAMASANADSELTEHDLGVRERGDEHVGEPSPGPVDADRTGRRRRRRE